MRAAFARACLFGSLLAASACAPADSIPLRPNLVFVLVDTLRADFLAAYGHPRPTTPNLSAFAEEAVLFEQATSQAACTWPSVNSLFTSRHPGLFLDQPGGSLGIPAGVPTLAELLAGAGWATHAVSASPIVRREPSKYNPTGDFDAGFGGFDDRCLWKHAGCVTRTALQALPKLPEPFFLYLHYMDPHDPYLPPRKHPRRFAGAYRGGKRFIARGNPRPIEDQVYSGGPDVGVTAEDIEHLKDLYAEETAFFDFQFGRLLAALREFDRLDRTIVVVASDHGEDFLEHGHVKHCRSLFDSATQVPLLIRLPGGVHSGRRDAVVQNLDVVPTLLDLMGVPAEEASFEGRSLRPLIESGAAPEAPAFSAQGTLRSVRTAQHKLIVDLATGESWLYDWRRDPELRTNLARTDPALLAAVMQPLQAWIDRHEGDADAGIPGAGLEQQLRALGYLE